METAAGVTRPVPRASELTRPFWEACRRGVLLVQCCRSCSHHVFTPQDFCRSCLSPDLDWVESAGDGIIVTYTTIWRPQTPAFEVPCVVAVVALTEGYEMLTNIVDSDPAEILVGAKVHVAFREIAPEVTLPCFAVVAA
ncbi:OB-fold domain-containing protein [Pseudonocardia ailaonensis]|uniref:OB-fold domain-containing protein n=1 Tax=Pseudonocardia ailaonensis TaxID=367279 RepID=A0ABN2MTV9_9PSEU